MQLPISADVMRFFLLVCIVGMALLAVLSLRGRGLSREELLHQVLLIVLLPVLGPFLVIVAQSRKRRA